MGAASAVDNFNANGRFGSVPADRQMASDDRFQSSTRSSLALGE